MWGGILFFYGQRSVTVAWTNPCPWSIYSLYRLSFLVTDVQQAMMSSRRQSIFPSVPPRPTSCDLLSWYGNSYASQPLRRPSGQSSVGHKHGMPRRRPDFSDICNRRASCFSRLEAPVSKAPASVSPLALDYLTRKATSRMTPSPFLRGSFWQSQKGDTIQEGKETPSPL